MICNIPFNTLTHTPDGFQTCCFHNMDIVPTMNANDFWNSKIMQEMRRGIIEGNPVDQCKECMKFYDILKDNPCLPPPNVFTDVVDDDCNEPDVFFDGYLTSSMIKVESELNPTVAVMNISNKCNLACRTCSPFLSDTQAAFRRKAGIENNDRYKRKQVDSFINEMNSYTNLREVILVGGEPMLDPVYVELLNKLDKKLSVRVQCNGTIYNEMFLEELMKFRKVTIGFSLDGNKKSNEYMRTNVKQEVFWNTVRKIISYCHKHRSDVNFGITSVLSNISAFYLKEIAEEIVNEIGSEGFITGKMFFGHILVNFPSYFRVSNLDEDSRVKLLDKLRSDELWYADNPDNPLGCKLIGINEGIRDLLKSFPCVEKDFTEFKSFNLKYNKLLKENLVKEIK